MTTPTGGRMLIDTFRMQDDANRVWFTADHHFQHENIIKFCNRPFANVSEMNAALTNNWNRLIKPDDIVFHLGDFCLGNSSITDQFFEALNGHIKVLGNLWHHDKRWLDYLTKNPNDPHRSYIGAPVEILPPMVVLEVPWSDTQQGHPLAITLCHYPLAEWDRKHYGAWHLHGHSHGKHQHAYKPGEQAFILDVGVDAQNYCPINLGGVLDSMYGQGWVAP